MPNHLVNGFSQFCPGCQNTVMRFEKGVIALNKIPMVCPYCATSFTYNLKGNPHELIGNEPVYAPMQVITA
jgi:hypothetical protein